ncbi:hypothetical protein GCM10010411_18540 [Actinomadura fulvescens]|uniref:Uncharacterized protein n=1 Tax=Actinomadura fulvescens TaxID=46160 RepID=A0ABN3PMA4_9ACTN
MSFVLKDVGECRADPPTAHDHDMHGQSFPGARGSSAKDPCRAAKLHIRPGKYYPSGNESSPGEVSGRSPDFSGQKINLLERPWGGDGARGGRGRRWPVTPKG